MQTLSNTRIWYAAFLLALGTVLAGCTVAVKNTDGIKACATEQAKAELDAVRIKERYKPESDEYKSAGASFNASSDSVSIFYKSIVDEVDLDRRVDVSKERFVQSDAKKRLDEFRAVATKLMGSGAVPDPNLMTAVIDFVARVVQLIIDQDKKQVDEALTRIRTALLQKAKPLYFDQISTEAVEARYALPKSP